ncbi:hypothetical protein [Vibrio sp. TBV020]|uniref:hypothetical protein n=1 Tax=Vibrio sp. TBV020 TaxID=3137398 RepID=UPI0038CDBB7A
MNHSAFNLEEKAFEPFFLEKASPFGRDIVFEGVVLAEVHAEAYQYRLYHTNATKPEHQFVMARMRLQDGVVKAELIGLEDTDAFEAFFEHPSEFDLGLNVLHEICRQSQFPGYRTFGQCTTLGDAR